MCSVDSEQRAVLSEHSPGALVAELNAKNVARQHATVQDHRLEISCNLHRAEIFDEVGRWAEVSCRDLLERARVSKLEWPDPRSPCRRPVVASFSPLPLRP